MVHSGDRRIRTALPALLLGWALFAPGAAFSAVILSVDQAEGVASLGRADRLSPLVQGSALQAGDRIATQAASLALKLSRYGRIEIGPASTLWIEQLPVSSYADDLRTLLTLKEGYLHLAWERPDLVTPWPVILQLGGFRLELASGDYHFEAQRGEVRFCVVEGEVTLPAAIHPLPLKGPACYPLNAGFVPQAVQRGPADFSSMLKNFSIGRLPTVAPVPVRALSALPAPPARPVTPAAVPSSIRPPRQSRSPLAPAGRAHRKIALPQQGPWVLNISSVSTSSDAQRELEGLHAAGYSATEITAVQIKDKLWYRLRIRNLANREETERLSREIERKLGYKTIWVSNQ